MNTKLFINALILLTLSFTLSVKASPTEDLIKAFVSASESARQHGAKDEALANYLSFFTDDFTDNHASYGVSFTGKEHHRKGLINKGSSMVSVVEAIENIIIGTDTAIVVVNEDSKYYKNDKLKHYKGRTIFVLEFNEQDLIVKMSRYMDQ
jgi:hypothetical protein